MKYETKTMLTLDDSERLELREIIHCEGMSNHTKYSKVVEFVEYLATHAHTYATNKEAARHENNK